MSERQQCTAWIWPSWATAWMRCDQWVNPNTGRCYLYRHEQKEMQVADPIDTAEQDALEARREQQRTEMNEVSRRFWHHAPRSERVVQAHQQARRLGESFALWLVASVPDCEERRKAIDALDLATMHSNAAIARTQLGLPAEEVDTPRQ